MRHEKGFTLIELMIVSAIISVIAAIAIPSFISSTRLADERSASASLRGVCTMEFEMRAGDADMDGYSNFWVLDIAGMYGFAPVGTPLRRINLDVARADNGNAASYGSVGSAAAKAGYWFSQVISHNDGTTYDSGTGRNMNRFGLVAYPDAYGVSGNLVFIMDETGTMYKQDSQTVGVADGGGQPAIVYPSDPAADGWSGLD